MFLTQHGVATPGATSSSPVARPVYTRKLGRLRFGWFVLGSAFGAALTWYVFSTAHKMEYGENYKASHAYALLGAKLAPLPHVAAPAPVAVAKAVTPAPPIPQLAPVLPPVTLAAVIVPARPAFPAQVNVAVRHGDTLMSMLMDHGIAHEEAYQAVQSIRHVYNPGRLNVGQTLELHLDKAPGDSRPSLSGLSIAVSPLKTVAMARDVNDGFSAREIRSEVYKDTARGGGTIHSSLYQTGIEGGVPPQLLGEVINALSYDIDFQRDIKDGDAIDVVYERMHTSRNTTAGYGNVLYASLTMGDRTFTIYRHASPDGTVGYYNERGESVRKALLKTPINGARITSGFGMRVHPLLGYTKMHKGIDFGAAIGTPIYAAGDGVIAEAGRKGGYGNYVRITHNATYATAYGHASRIASGIRPGMHVHQGQVIAYVGSTGRSTGPHLHYEILVGGVQVNPAGVKFRTGQTLGGADLGVFKGEKAHIENALNTLPQNTQVASLER